MGEKQNKEKSARYKKRVQIISLIACIAVLALATVLSIPLIKSFRTEEGMDALKEQLREYGGVLEAVVFTLIQALQVVIAIIPPVQIAGGVLFGWFLGALLSFAGIMLGTLLIFVIVQKFGRPLVEAFVDEKLMTRYKFLQDEKKLVHILMILYLIPGIPKDVLSYIVPLTKVSRRDFFLYVLPCRIPAIVLSTVLGSNVAGGNFRTAIIILAACVPLAIIGYVIKDPVLRLLEKRHNNK